jgi:exonuclease SbcD
MRFLHTADWHLGRSFRHLSLVEDQAHVLDQLVDLAIHERVDAVVIAGDVYDRAVPPADAVALLDDVLARLVLAAGIRVVLIAGNHDSPDRVGFGGRIAERQGLAMRGTLEHLAPVVFNDAYGQVALYPLPYVEPAFARRLQGAESANDHQSAVSAVLALLRAQWVPGQRNVLVGHAFVAGGTESESERPLSVGGSGAVSTATFDGYDFVALGHLHRPQSVGSDRVQYSGSLLKYSFNEVDHSKSVSLVEIGQAGATWVQRVPLSARHDVRIVRGSFAELLAAPQSDESLHDHIRAVLTDRDPVLNAQARLKEVYPNLLELQFSREIDVAAGVTRGAQDHRQRSPDDLFKAFHRDMLGEDIDDSALGVFHEVAQSVISTDGERSA